MVLNENEYLIPGTDLIDLDSVQMSNDKAHECGLMGVYYPGTESKLDIMRVGMLALRNRGQSGAGIAVFDDYGMPKVNRGKGSVKSVLTPDFLASCAEYDKSPTILGHIRYSTSGDRHGISGTQPFYPPGGNWALAHNGHMELIGEDLNTLSVPEPDILSDSHALTMGIHDYCRKNGIDLLEGLRQVLPQIRPAYSLLIGQGERLIGARDNLGMRPLVIGQWATGGYVLCSETIALDKTGATYIDDVNPGELVVADSSGLYREQLTQRHKESFCVFELIYFMHQGSLYKGEHDVASIREALGFRLGFDTGLTARDADIVLPVLDSGLPAAQGFARSTGILLDTISMTRDDNVDRTFINDKKSEISQIVALKQHVNSNRIAGKRVVIVDDSIVRGNTQQKLVLMLKDAGAVEVIVAIPSPMYMRGCFYGMDTRNLDDLVAYEGESETVRQYIGADRLFYLSLNSFRKSLNLAINSGESDNFCMGCMDSNYPTDIPVSQTKKQIH